MTEALFDSSSAGAGRAEATGGEPDQNFRDSCNKFSTTPATATAFVGGGIKAFGGCNLASDDPSGALQSMQADERLVTAKQENVDYFYSGCNGLNGAQASIPAPVTFTDGCNSAHFPSFFSHSNSGASASLSRNSANELRRTDEMLSGQSYRLFGLNQSTCT